MDNWLLPGSSNRPPLAQHGTAPPSGPIWGALYRWTLVRVPVDHPLFEIVYIGQAIRATATSADDAAEQRWKEEERDAKSNPRCFGLSWAIDEFGVAAFDREVVESRFGPRAVLQPWANEREIALIAAHGGVLRDQTRRLKQTLNILPGGRGLVSNAAAFASRALSAARWAIFIREMWIFVNDPANKFGCRVPREYVTPAGYHLGDRLASVRSGGLVAEHPERQEELRKLPLWTDEPWLYGDIWKQRLSNWHRQRISVLWEHFMSEMRRYISDHPANGCHVPDWYVTPEGYPLGQSLRGVRTGELVDGKSERLNELQQLPGWGDGDWRGSNATRALQSSGIRAAYAAKTDDEKALHRAACKERANRPEVKARQSKRAIAQAKREKELYGADYRSNMSKASHSSVKTRTKISKNQVGEMARRSASILDKALQTVLPYQPKKAKRVYGKFYWRVDGKIGRWDGCSLRPIRNQPYDAQSSSAQPPSAPLPVVRSPVLQRPCSPSLLRPPEAYPVW
mgnify:CR=1 FL=1